MDDPWDVKSVRRAGQYISCMKINGSPLLPPVLSKECHKEMQYYKLLAKEVEKRISSLQPYIENDHTDTTADQEENGPPEEAALSNLNTLQKQSQETELPTSDFFELSSPNVVTTTDISKLVIDFSLSINQSGRNILETVKRWPPPIEFPERHYTPSKEKQLLTNVQTTGKQQDKIKTKVLEDIKGYRNTIKNDFPIVESIEGQGDLIESKLLQNLYKTAVRNNYAPVNTIPHRIDKEKNKDKELDDIERYRIVNEDLSQTHEDSSFCLEADMSLSTKSFTGSLNDLHTESLKDLDIPNITRQRSYTVLNPSPQLLAHLEVQSINTGVEVKSISMSESLSSLVTLTSKKRRSWDLESAKVKWSSMAQDLKNKNLPGCNARNSTKQTPKVTTQASYSPPPKAKTICLLDKNKRATPSKCGAKAEAISKRKLSPHRDYPSNTTVTLGPTSTRSPLRKRLPPPQDFPSNTTVTLGPVSARSPSQKRQPPPRSPPTPRSPRSPPVTLAREGDNPGKMVRELYEKVQRDQTAQMASLVEKQRKEQKRLQQVFEQQNNVLFKQLKTIVPEGNIEAKQAWGADNMEPERGPVTLSQLINHNKNDHQISLTDTHNYISKCDTVLKKSRDISSTIKKPKAVTPNGNKSQSPKVPDRSKSKCRSPVRNMASPTRKALNLSPTMSPAGRHLFKSPQSHISAQRSSSRKLNYDISSERELDVILTDRTNDTLADLNVTFPTDKSDTASSRSVSPPVNENKLTIIHSVSVTPKPISDNSRDSANNGVENTSKHFLKGNVYQHSLVGNRPGQAPPSPPPKQLAAASKIVAFAKGYLVRRLMRTERVTATVQTIRDALLCALQLHQDREGIRGADVDLHRRLIQQITAACYSLHDTFITSTPAERCALIASDRARLLRPRPMSAQSLISRRTDVMSQSHSGVFPPRPRRASASLMTQSTYETHSSDKGRRPRYAPSPRRRPWR